MAQTDNRIVIQVRTGQDVEINNFKDDRYVAHTTAAYTGRRKQGDDFVDGATSWFKITAWDNTAKILAKIPKGALILVDGRIEIEEWETSAGEKRQTVAITADRISLPLMSPNGLEATDNGLLVGRGKRREVSRGARHQETPFVFDSFTGDDRYRPGTERYFD